MMAVQELYAAGVPEQRDSGDSGGHSRVFSSEQSHFGKDVLSAGGKIGNRLKREDFQGIARTYRERKPPGDWRGSRRWRLGEG